MKEMLLMDNYEAIAYAAIAVEQLKKEGLEINRETLKSRMLYLMNRYSEREIYKRYSE